ncbi:MAG: glycosyltransferase family 2 protein [Sulfitobacter sp.]|nr:glycosyltransferase family 2 protein [Sulfitobacter sp.]
MSVIVPVHNEAPAIAGVVSGIVAELAADRPVVVIVVDDGSTDDTVDVVQALVDTIGDIELVRHPENRGYGAAISTGWAQAATDLVAIMDGDGQYGPGDLERLCRQADDGADAVVGVRTNRADPVGRRLLGRLGTGIARLVLRTSVQDINCGLKVFDRALVDGPLGSRGGFVSTELLWLASSQRVAVVELPVSHRPRAAGRQSGGSLRVLGLLVPDFVRVWRSSRRW